MSLSFYDMTQEEIVKLEKIYHAKQLELDHLQKTTGKEMWLKDLEQLEQYLTKHYQQNIS
jgi:hypothetical protein